MSRDDQFIPYPGFVPPMSSTVPVTSQFPHITSPFTSAPHTTYPVSAPMGEPFLGSSPHVMPLSNPYHPFHVGYSTEDILASLQLQQDALSRRIQELERAPRPPCHYQTAFTEPHTPFPSHSDSDVRFLPLDRRLLTCFILPMLLRGTWCICAGCFSLTFHLLRRHQHSYFWSIAGSDYF
ncbi:hypothetical protein Hdeb2414_s0171g00822291 [Helianthus debilis subsp. tardiflorus]